MTTTELSTIGDEVVGIEGVPWLKSEWGGETNLLVLSHGHFGESPSTATFSVGTYTLWHG